MYPDFLGSPELALECLRQENRIRDRDADQYRPARHAAALRPTRRSGLLGAVKALFYACLHARIFS